jgi:hypothetical protein
MFTCRDARLAATYDERIDLLDWHAWVVPFFPRTHFPGQTMPVCVLSPPSSNAFCAPVMTAKRGRSALVPANTCPLSRDATVDDAA